MLHKNTQEMKGIYAPQLLRVLVRRSEIILTLLAGMIGAVGGICVLVVTRLTLWAHALLYGLKNGGRLSGLDSLPFWRCVVVLGGGGIIVGLFGVLVSRLMLRRPVDPVEANALHGGQMSVRDSILLVAQTILSNGVGASIGLEAGFTQIASALGSRLGSFLRVRREDMRVLVGAGAAGAIGAAFNAPVGGAFYAFELVIGTYCLSHLFPIAVAAVAGVCIMHLWGEGGNTFSLLIHWHMGWHEALGVAVLSIACALSAIVMMYCVTQTEAFFRRFPGPSWIRPAIGGVCVALLAMYSPSVLSAGHAGMTLVLSGNIIPSVALILLCIKALASCISIGSGFRGGLFFASLYLGALAGEGYGAFFSSYGFAPNNLVVCSILGMSAMASAIIGGPMTIICMMLEMTGNVSLGGGIVLASVLSLLTVRRLFGYNFATWRFHLRGETIRSAVDVGWMRSLSVQRLMRDRVRGLPGNVSVSQARELFPLGSGQRIMLISQEGRYEGQVSIIELNASSLTEEPVSRLARFQEAMLIPQMDVQEAIDLFTEAQADILVVVEDHLSRQVVGQLSEHHTLRRYTAELERCRRELAGEDRFPV